MTDNLSPNEALAELAAFLTSERDSILTTYGGWEAVRENAPAYGGYADACQHALAILARVTPAPVMDREAVTLDSLAPLRQAVAALEAWLATEGNDFTPEPGRDERQAQRITAVADAIMALAPTPHETTPRTVTTVEELEALVFEFAEPEVSLRDSDGRPWIVWSDQEGDLHATSYRSEDDTADYDAHLASLEDIAFPATVLSSAPALAAGPGQIIMDIPEPGCVTHACPPEGKGVMPCYGRTPFEVPRTDRITIHRGFVTCQPAPATVHVTDEQVEAAKALAWDEGYIYCSGLDEPAFFIEDEDGNPYRAAGLPVEGER